MIRAGRLSTLIGLAVIALAAVLFAGDRSDHALAASPAGPVALAAIDTDITGNAANSAGTTEACNTIASVGGTLQFDVVAKGVPAYNSGNNTGGLAGYQVVINTDPGKVSVTAVSDIFMTAGGFGFSGAVPDADGSYTAAAATFAAAPLGGDGVLARITLTATGAGTSPITLVVSQTGEGD
jgi:hypothetical protein